VLLDDTPFAYFLPLLSGYWLIGAFIGLVMVYAMKLKPQDVEKLQQEIWEKDDGEDAAEKQERIDLLGNRAFVFLFMVFFWPVVLTIKK
jgi:hypothetical protein